MKLYRSIGAGFLLLLCGAAGAAAQDDAGSSGPAMIKLMTSDIVVAADSSSTQTLHVEMQASSEAVAMRVGQTSLPFDTATQDISVVEAHTLKADGKTVPVQPSAIYDQMQSGVQAQMLTTLRSKVIVFPQFGAGDTAVYTIKLVTRQPLFAGQFEYGASYLRNVAYDEVRETITAPKSLPLQVENHEVDFSKKDSGTDIVYSWHYAAPKRSDDEAPAISPLDHQPRFFASSFKDYTQLGHAYAAFADGKLAVTPKVSALADEITMGTVDRKAQAQKLYEWVSAHIRYVAIELGQGSFTPHDADLILANGYGDCKDHDVILQALLKAKGIAAQTILLNATNSYSMTEVPTFVTLDHAITFVPEFGVYLDSTAAVAPFGVLPMPEYGKPMVVAALSGAGAKKMPLLPPGLAKITVKTVTALDKDGQISGTTTTTATGPYAITLRQLGLAIQVIGPTAVSKLLTSLGYKDGSGAFTQDSPTALTPSDTITGTFKASGWTDEVSGKSRFFLPGGLRLFSLSGDGIMGSFNPANAKNDTQTLCFSAQATEDLSLKAPPGMQFSETPKDTKVQTPNLLFVAHWSLEGDTLSVHRDFTSTIDKPFCEGAVREQAAAAVKQIADSYNTNISFVQASSAAASASKTDQAETYVNDGLEQLNAGQYTVAIDDFDKALSLQPDDADTLNDRGAAQFKAGHYALAIADLNKAIALKPDLNGPYYNRALAEDRLGQYDAAIPDLNKAIAQNPDHADMLDNRGWAHMQAGHLALAIADFDKAIALKPENPEMTLAYYNRGLARDQQGQYAAAIADFDKAIAMKPDDAAQFNDRGWAHMKANQYDLAMADFSKVIALKAPWWQTYYNRGWVYEQLNQFDAAELDFDKAFALNPDNEEALSGRGWSLFKIGHNNAGLADLNKAIALKPETHGLYYTRGLILVGMNRYSDAITDFDKAIAMYPQNADYFNDRGRAYRLLKQYDKALADLDKAVVLNPDHALAYYNRGVSYAALRQVDRAIEEFSKAVKLKPDYYYTYESRAAAYANARQYPLAIADAGQAIQLNPDDAFAYYVRGFAYYQTGKRAQAIGDFDKAIAKKPDYAAAFFFRGNAENKLGMTVEGNRDIEHAMKLDPKMEAQILGTSPP